MKVEKKPKIRAVCWVSALYFILLPLTISTNETSNSYLKLATVPIGLFLLIALFFYKGKLNINMVHVFLVLYTLSVPLTLMTDPSARAISAVIGYFLNCALFICISIFDYRDIELKLLENAQILMLVSICVITLIENVGQTERGTITIFGDACDPNYFVGFFIFPLTIVLKNIADCKWKWKIPNIILALTSLYVIFLSGSRGGLLAVAVTVFTFVFIYPKGLAKKIIITAGVIVLASLTWIAAKPILPELVVERMNITDVIESRGTYRMDIWEQAVDEIINESEYVILGRGIDARINMLIAGKYTSEALHSAFLQIAYGQGMLGFALFLLLAGACMIRCMRKQKIIVIAVIGMLALGISLSFNASTKTYWNLICYAALPFATKVCSEEKNLEEEIIYET